jgi:hypothetical protein
VLWCTIRLSFLLWCLLAAKSSDGALDLVLITAAWRVQQYANTIKHIDTNFTNATIPGTILVGCGGICLGAWLANRLNEVACFNP